MTTPGILYMDGFSHYGPLVSHMLDDPSYTHIDSGYSLSTPSWDGTDELALTCQTSSAAQICRRVLSATKTALLTSFHFAIDTLANVDIYNWQDASNVVICKLSLSSTGALSLKLADGTVLGTTTTSPQSAQLWQFYEMKLDCSAKTFELHIDDENGTDTPVLNLTGLSISSGPIKGNSLLPLSGSTPKAYLKNLIVRDPAGSINNGFQGEYVVGTDFVDGDGSTQEWVPFYNSGPALGAYSTIDKAVPTDTTYIEADDSTPVTSDFTASSLAVDTTIIGGVMIIQRSYKSNPDAAYTSVGIAGANGATTDATAHFLSETPTYYGDVFEYDPDTSGRISPKTLINGRVRIVRTI